MWHVYHVICEKVYLTTLGYSVAHRVFIMWCHLLAFCWDVDGGQFLILTSHLIWNTKTHIRTFISRHIGILQMPEPFLRMEVAATIVTITITLLIIFLGVTLLWKPSPRLKTLGGKHVLITGGSSGIGLAIAKEALSQGAFVTLIARSSAKLEKAIDKLVNNKTISVDRICSKVHLHVLLILTFIIGVGYLLGSS